MPEMIKDINKVAHLVKGYEIRIRVPRHGEFQGVVKSAVNWRDSLGSDWYIEFSGETGAHYWKQQQDGGEIIWVKNLNGEIIYQES